MFKTLLKNFGSYKTDKTEDIAVELEIKSNQKESELSETAEILLNSYPKEVIEIHNKFNNEAEELLKEAIEMSKEIVVDPAVENKALLAHKFGFSSIKEVEEFNEINYRREVNEITLNAINEAKEYISDYKWIPETSVERICKEYSLVFGGVEDYKGFLPNKNLLEIDEFSKKHEDKLNYCIDISFRSDNSMEFFENKELAEEYALDKNSLMYSYSHYATRNSIDNLKICAPIKDMHIRDQILVDGYKLERSVPDPIVLARRDFNGVQGYYIVTAWGNEASDPEVLNK